MRIRTKLALVTTTLILVSFAACVLSLPRPSEPELKEAQSIPALTGMEIRNPEIALKYGVVGYLEISMSPGASESLTLMRGSGASITILFHFVSYVPEVTETQVKIDPHSGDGLKIEQVYVIQDEKGNIIGRGTANINELVSYDPNGVVVIKAGQTLPVTLTIHMPKDFPSIQSFPLSAVGITADVPIINDVSVTVYA